MNAIRRYLPLLALFLLADARAATPPANVQLRDSAPLFQSVTSTATTLTEIIAAPASGKSIYITSMTISSSAAATTNSNEQLLFKYGTGSNCATGTTQVFGCLNIANGGCVWPNAGGPEKLPAANALCFIAAAAGTKIVNVTYYIQ